MAENKESGILKALRQNRKVQVNPKEEQPIATKESESSDIDHIMVELRVDQVKKLNEIVQNIKLARNNKNKKRERITKSTILRTVLDSVDFESFDLKDIYSESDLKKRFSKAKPYL